MFTYKTTDIKKITTKKTTNGYAAILLTSDGRRVRGIGGSMSEARENAIAKAFGNV
jgi:hypothetical protein